MMADESLAESTLSDFAAKAAEAKKRQMEHTNLANQDREMSDSQMIAQAILGLAPMILGGIVGGKEGLHHGANAGVVGSSMYDQILEKKDTRADETNKALAKIFGEQASGYEKEAMGLKKGIALEENAQENREDLRRKFPSKGTTINIDNKSEGKLSELATKELWDAEVKRISGTELINEVRRAVEEVKKAGVKPDENWLEAVARNAAGEIDPSTPQGRLRTKLTSKLVNEAFELVKGNATEEEQSRLARAGGAKWNVPLREVEQILSDQENILNRRVNLIRSAAENLQLPTRSGVGGSSQEQTPLDSRMFDTPESAFEASVGLMNDGYKPQQIAEISGGKLVYSPIKKGLFMKNPKTGLFDLVIGDPN